MCGAVRVCDGEGEEVDLLLPRDGHLVLRELLQREARELVRVERLRLQPQREGRPVREGIAPGIARELRGNRVVFACFASANIAYTFDIPNGACSLKRSLRRKRLMLNTVSGVSAVNGSSVYLRARGDAANERDGVRASHLHSSAQVGRSSVYLWTELYAKYLLEGGAGR